MLLCSESIGCRNTEDRVPRYCIATVLGVSGAGADRVHGGRGALADYQAPCQAGTQHRRPAVRTIRQHSANLGMALRSVQADARRGARSHGSTRALYPRTPSSRQPHGISDTHIVRRTGLPDCWTPASTARGAAEHLFCRRAELCHLGAHVPARSGGVSPSRDEDLAARLRNMDEHFSSVDSDSPPWVRRGSVQETLSGRVRALPHDSTKDAREKR